MAEYNTFLDIVTQRDDPTIDRDNPTCPYCQSTNVTDNGGSTTLVGGYYNHIHHDCRCNDCKERFMLEIKEQGKRDDYIAWYTDKDGKILGGIPGCFESYTYTCSKCGGDVHRHQLEINSDTPVRCLSSGADENGVWQDHYRNIFRCDSCGVEVESENDYFRRNPPPPMTYEEKVEAAKKRKAAAEKFASEWTVTEEIGVTIVNDYALAKVEIDKDKEDK